jgi:hypothetical protein
MPWQSSVVGSTTRHGVALHMSLLPFAQSTSQPVTACSTSPVGAAISEESSEENERSSGTELHPMLQRTATAATSEKRIIDVFM